MSEHLQEIRAQEQSVEGMELLQERLRGQGRAAMGVTGERTVASLRQVMRAASVGWYPVLALGALGLVDQFQTSALNILAPEISNTVGLRPEVLAGFLSIRYLVVFLAALPIAAFVQQRPRRAAIAIATAFVWSIATVATGFVTETWGLLAVLVVAGAASGSVYAVHSPLVIDTYPTSIRVRMLSTYYQALYVALAVGPIAIVLLTGPGDLTWRGVFVGLGLLSLCGALFSVRLRDPGFGKWDTEKIRHAVRAESGADAGETVAEVPLGVFEVARRLFLIPTIRRLFLMVALYGMLYLPFQTFSSFYLDEQWNLGPSSRSLVFAGIWIMAVAALVVFARRSESMFQRDPARLVRMMTWLMAASVVALVPAVTVPSLAAVVVALGVSVSLVAVVSPMLLLSILGIIPARTRPHASALFGVFLAVGSFGGLILLGGLDQRYGIGPAMLSLVIPGGLSMIALYSCAKTIGSDLNRTIDAVVEEEEIRTLARRGTRLPMLAVRRLDFSYGQLQVLFDVNFTVDEGEIVALLGTNGAGKSTLLRAISGMGLPTNGSVRFRGSDITYVAAERRSRLGITQIPGGRAVFGPLTVVDNLRAFAAVLGADRRSVDAAIEVSFNAFPALAQRRNQLASTLSGGEQQMLGLCKALILKPCLLLVDELSLGLSPKIVSGLLETLRQINEAGTAVVLVEQSINIALSVVQHAYFMEKGEIRFDGGADELIERPDLLRSVFLQGAAKGLADTPAERADDAILTR